MHKIVAWLLLYIDGGNILEENIEENLKYLCQEFLIILNKEESNELITKVEYEKYAENKKEFLQKDILTT